MALPVSTLSQVSRAIADFLSERLNASRHNIHLLIGNPSDAVPKEGDKHRVNLFFYRLEPSGFEPGVAPDDPWLLRLHCLITAFGVLEEMISAGENDLRLLGEVIRIFHEKPILDAIEVAGEQVRTRVVFQPLSVDDLNHLWSTQGEVAYRPSVAYEMALIPVVPEERRREGPLVGALGLEVRADMAGRRAPFSGSAAAPPVTVTRVDTGREDWTPRICFVHAGACAESLFFELGSDELAGFTPAVWIAGEEGSQVTLVWEVWERAHGWRRHGESTPANATTSVLDPSAADTAQTTSLPLPFNDRAGQAVLYAARSYTRAGDQGRPDPAAIPLRSNPLLVNLYGGDG